MLYHVNQMWRHLDVVTHPAGLSNSIVEQINDFRYAGHGTCGLDKVEIWDQASRVQCSEGIC